MLTLTQLQSLCDILSDEEQVKKVIQNALDRHKTDWERWVASERLGQQKQLEWDTFEREIDLVRKTVDPLEILVTRPQVTCTYFEGRINQYEMRFWKKKYDHVNFGGNVSGGNNQTLLTQIYSEARQPDHLVYPMHSRDFSSLFPGYHWVRRTETVRAASPMSPNVYKIDFFTLVKDA